MPYSETKFVIEGLSEFKVELQHLPEELAEEGADIVESHARAAQTRIVNSYPEVTGNLKRGVKLEIERSRWGVHAIVHNGAPHSHLYEFGTEMRYDDGRPTGIMKPAPPGRAFIPQMIDERNKMHIALMQLLIDHGLIAEGSTL